jgi:hypothetical protein
MKSNTDTSICLHLFLDEFWWMDGKGFLLIKEYLDNYFQIDYEFSDKFIDQLLYVIVHKRDLISNKDIFNIATLGKRALLLSFTNAGIGFGDSDRSIKFELIYKENERIMTRKITF